MNEWLNIFRECMGDKSAITTHDKSAKTDKSSPESVPEDTFGGFDSFGTAINGKNHLTYAERFQERAAVIEYDGGMPRTEAERLAYQEMLAEFVRLNYPAVETELRAILQGE